MASFIGGAFDDLRRLKVSCVEVRVGNWGEVVALNTSGLKFTMRTTAYGGVSASETETLKDPYPLLDTIQRKLMICQNLSSTYAYDFPEIFANALALDDAGGAAAGVSNNRISSLVELVLDHASGSLVETQRPAGMNDVGMVCWRATLITDEYPTDGREIVLVANDITHMSGSFSPKEDAVYRATFDLARQALVPSPPTRGAPGLDGGQDGVPGRVGGPRSPRRGSSTCTSPRTTSRCSAPAGACSPTAWCAGTPARCAGG